MICYVIKPPGNNFFISCLVQENLHTHPPLRVKFGSHAFHPSLLDSSLALNFPSNTLTVETFLGLVMGNGLSGNSL